MSSDRVGLVYRQAMAWVKSGMGGAGAGDWLAMACCGVVVGQAVVLAVWGRAGVPGAVAAGAVGATPGEAGLGCCPGVNVWPEGFSWALPCG